jgi:transketolase
MKLEEKAKEVRKKVLDFALETGIGHLGGSFSEIEILVSLYYDVLKKEDKFILSKGHTCNPYYILLKEKGYNPKLSEHPDIDEENGIWCTTGSLGHGLPIGIGMAFARKIQNKRGNIYVLIGDGECQEGTIWESMNLASRYKLDNLNIIVDYNELQAINFVEDVLPTNLKNKFDAFGGKVIEVDGHNFNQLIPALKEKVYSRPKVILAHTIKGKGVSYMENDIEWHAKKPTQERLAKAYEELK